MDNRTHDVRRVIPWTCFSIEPSLPFRRSAYDPRSSFVGDTEARVQPERSRKN
jgi:hypothetical protein